MAESDTVSKPFASDEPFLDAGIAAGFVLVGVALALTDIYSIFILGAICVGFITHVVGMVPRIGYDGPGTGTLALYFVGVGLVMIF